MIADGMEHDRRDPDRANSLFLLALIAAFWLLHFVTLTAQRLISSGSEGSSTLLPRFCVTLAAIAVSVGIARVLSRFSGRRLPVKLAVALALAVAGCLLHAAVNFAIFQAFLGKANWEQTSFESYFMAVISWFWNYSAVCGMLLALSYYQELGQAQREAHRAQLRALRYQLNPHFMFNTLNSIVALVSRRDVETAERMVEDLADFLRATLTLDPEQDIPLEQEIGLQSLYLEIERIRFAERLTLHLDVPTEAASALVPSLITQPLAENVIRHAVAVGTGPVRFELRARRNGSRLRLTAHNSEPDGTAAAAAGTGVGLANVAERLRARYGADHRFTAGGEPGRGFTVEIDIPFVGATGP